MMSTPNRTFQSLFSPEHIILIGASERPYSLGERVLSSLLRSGFQGRITPVNPKHKTIGGIKTRSHISRVNEATDLAVIVTPPATITGILRTCEKKQIQHIAIIQDWDNLSIENYQIIKSAIESANQPNNIITCTTAGIQNFSSAFNAGIYHSSNTGHTAVISTNASTSGFIFSTLKTIDSGVSKHISLHSTLCPPDLTADILNFLTYDANTRLAILEYDELFLKPQLFSAIRQFTQKKKLILHCSHFINTEERAVLNNLASEFNFLFSQTPEALTAAIHALINDKKPATKLTVLSNSPCSWLQNETQQSIDFDFPSATSRPSEKLQGFIGSNPSTLSYLDKSENLMQQPQTEALLCLINPTADHNENDIAQSLKNLQNRHGKLVLTVCSHPSGLAQFNHYQTALQCFSYHQINYLHLQHLSQTAKPWPTAINQLSVHDNFHESLTELLNTYPEIKNNKHHLPIEICFSNNSSFGQILTITANGQTSAILPPFTMLHARELSNQFDLPNHFVSTLLSFLNTESNRLQNIEFNLPLFSDGLLSYSEKSTEHPNIKAPYPTIETAQTILKNGATVYIRALVPEDADKQQQFIRDLSEENRYTRFMYRIKELDQSTLARFSNLDYHREGAFIAETANKQIVGIAHFSSKKYPESCEFGISVADTMHGQGLATLLMQKIIHYAASIGYQSMTAEILVENHAMLKLAEKQQFTLTISQENHHLYCATRQLHTKENNKT